MEQLLIADHTRQQLQSLLTDTPHAILLVGPIGIGKRTLAQTLGLHLTDKAHLHVLEPDEKGTLSIESVRPLYQLTRTKQEKHQVIIIDHAQAMGIEAQNALLKLLEEPRIGVTFILTAPTDDSLLPTIMSRVQVVKIPRVSMQALQKLATSLGANLSQQELMQLLFVADGRPAILVRLLQNPDVFAAYKQLMQQAKKILSASPYERLAQVSAIKSKDEAIRLLEAMGRIIHVQLLRQPNKPLAKFADDIQDCLARLAQNGNPRAQLTALFVAH